MMHDQGQSDSSVVPRTLPNKAAESAAEAMEGSGLAKGNPSLSALRFALVRVWRVTLQRRSQTGHVRWDRMTRLARRWLPFPRICHPYPAQRFAFATQGKSRMR